MLAGNEKNVLDTDWMLQNIILPLKECFNF